MVRIILVKKELCRERWSRVRCWSHSLAAHTKSRRGTMPMMELDLVLGAGQSFARYWRAADFVRRRRHDEGCKARLGFETRLDGLRGFL